MLAGVKQADEGRDEIMRGLEEAWAGRKDLDGQMRELHETVDELKRLIMQQGEQLTDLNARIATLSRNRNGGDQ